MDSGSTNVGTKGIIGTATFTDDAGNSDPIYSVPVWKIDHPEAFTSVTPSADGLTCAFAGPITAMTVTGSVTAEGDPTVGKNPLSDTFTIEVLAPLVPEDTKISVAFTPIA